MSDHAGTGSGAQASGRDPIDMREYSTERVVQAVGARWAPPATGDWLLIVLSPAFDPDLVITAHRMSGQSRIMVHTAQCNLWYFHHQAINPRPGGYDLRPDRAWAAAELDGNQADELWRRASAILAMPPPGPDEWDVALDSMTVTTRIRLGEDFKQRENPAWWRGPVRPLVETALDLAEPSGDHRITAVIDAALGRGRA